MSRLDGSIRSPNIWDHPATYEIENRAVDPDGRLWEALRTAAGPSGWSGRDVLDLGCGTGFHLPLFASTARSVVGVEPHASLAALARRRSRRLPNVSVLEGVAQALPLPPASVDVVHVRWAYFFGPGAEPGLAELARVARRGGTAMVIDNDATRSTFGAWFRRGYPTVDPEAVEAWWSRHGWSRQSIDMGWRFTSREDLEAVVRIEFAPAVAEEILNEHWGSGGGLEVDYAVNLWSRDF
ncbi:class I SAM-dependent methyltransferase [Nocardioides sp. Kera G14]|uniref:class I SAM-dependent methyltransferase n=1 Tax=Nocardioides sp. Kera G14 TaxID=2884264 RepID=UPI001D1268EB|nr:class I SAM-dependent methyltransferase [Nocardioides sp. Kera G14]UDY23862.1 class I SAM-dependent methyltransferase [Nocardioides sp. Kera G14]